MRTYYFQNSWKLDKTISRIKKSFPCKIIREYVEMNYSKISIDTAERNYQPIEEILKSLTK